MNYSVSISTGAKADIFETRNWLLEEHPEIADRWTWEISKCVASLSYMPQRCRISDESLAFDVEVRELLCGSRPHIYRILFAITQDDAVVVLRVRSTRQQRLIDQIPE